MAGISPEVEAEFRADAVRRAEDAAIALYVVYRFMRGKVGRAGAHQLMSDFLRRPDVKPRRHGRGKAAANRDDPQMASAYATAPHGEKRAVVMAATDAATVQELKATRRRLQREKQRQLAGWVEYFAEELDCSKEEARDWLAAQGDKK